MIPSKFDYVKPSSVEDAVRALAEGGEDAKILAGGQSLLPVLRLRLAAPTLLVDLGGIAELRGIREDGDRIAIGAMTPYYDIVMPCTPERVWRAIQAGAPVSTEGEREAAPHFDDGAPNADPAAGASEGSDQ